MGGVGKGGRICDPVAVGEVEVHAESLPLDITDVVDTGGEKISSSVSQNSGSVSMSSRADSEGDWRVRPL